MRIAFAAEYPDRRESFSGTPYYMSRAISAEAEYFQYIQCPNYDWQEVVGGLRWGSVERAGQFLSDRLRNMDVDVVICMGSSMIPFLDTEKRVVLWHDSTWFSYMRTEFEIFRSKYPLLYEWDRRTLARCDLIAFAADWVKEGVIEHYKVPAEKIHVVPFGANLTPMSRETVSESIAARDKKTCQLTFLGVDWLRKGLPFAYEVMRTLNRGGVHTELAVIGCQVPAISAERQLKHRICYSPFEQFQIQYWRDKRVKKIGFLRKGEPLEHRLLCEILKQTHFLLHPASFECFGVALVEANAFGVPVLATNNHGPRTIIRDGVNGQLFPQREYVERASECIMRYMNDFKAYESLALSSFGEFSVRLNWRSSCHKLKQIIGRRTTTEA